MMYQLVQMLYNLPRSGIFGVEDLETNSVRLYTSNSLIRALMIAIAEYQRTHPSAENLFFRLLEVSPDELLLNYWWSYYESKGFKVCNGKSPVSYKPITRIQRFGGELKVFVLLRSKGSFYITCGIFDHMTEARSYINDYLNPNGIVMPVIALNSSTKKFFIDSN